MSIALVFAGHFSILLMANAILKENWYDLFDWNWMCRCRCTIFPNHASIHASFLLPSPKRINGISGSNLELLEFSFHFLKFSAIWSGWLTSKLFDLKIGLEWCWFDDYYLVKWSCACVLGAATKTLFHSHYSLVHLTFRANQMNHH